MPTTNPEIATKILASANTEYKVTIPSGTKMIKIRNRNAVDLRYAFETGRVAAPIEPFGTIKSGTTYETSKVPRNDIASTEAGQVIYLASGTAAQVAELEFWS